MASNHYSQLNRILKNSVQDNLDDTYIEYCLYLLWKIDVLELIKLKASIAKQFHIQPSEIDRMSYWEYEYFVRYINDMVKEENDEQEKQMSSNDMGGMRKQINNMSKMKQPTYPKIPNISINGGRLK